MTKLLWCVVAAGVVVARPARGQMAALQEPGLLSYVRDVLTGNAGRAAAEFRVAASREAVAPAGALPDPMLTLGAMSVPTPSFDVRAEPMTQVPTAQLEQRFPFPGKQGARTAVARADRFVRVELLSLRDAGLAHAAARAYYGLAYARTAIKLWRERVALAVQALRVTETRYATGAVPQTDALRARLRRAQLADEGLAIEAAMTAAVARADALRGGTGDAIATGPLEIRADEPSPDSVLLAELEARSPALRVASAEATRAERQAHVRGIDW
ncbi:MAG: TolC family protein, partial [Gemmatimonadales bacterium]